MDGEHCLSLRKQCSLNYFLGKGRVELIKRILTLCVLVLLSNGCIKANDGSLNQRFDSGTLRIMYEDEYIFYEDFGKIFSYYYPDVNLEIIRPDNYSELLVNEEKLIQFIEQQRLDLVFLNRNQYRHVSSKGLIVNLEARIAQDSELNRDDFIKPVLDVLTLEGQGNIYGLAPFFQSRALYYNKDLFDKFSIPYPEDHQRWDDVLRLSYQFSQSNSDQNTYGLYYPFHQEQFNPFHLVSLMAESENLTMYNAQTNQFDLIGSRFEQLLELVISGLQYGGIYQPDASDRQDQFVAGHAAMRYEGYFYIGALQSSQFQWDIVSEPVGHQQSIHYSLDDIFAIPVSSDNQDLAWTFIKFTVGDIFQKIKSSSTNRYGFPVTNTAFSTMFYRDVNYQAFYALEPDMNFMNEIKSEMPVTVNIAAIMQQESLEALNGSQTVEEAIRNMENRLNEQLHGKGMP